MMISSLPARPLKKSELRSLEQSIEGTAPMVVRIESDGSEVYGTVYAATLVQEERVTAIVLEEDGWRVLDQRERPHPPPAFEKQFREWAEEYPELICLC